MYANLVLILIICGFWGVALSRIRQAGHRITFNLLILPVFFAVIGFALNNYWRAWSGTLVIGAIHAGLLLMVTLRSTRNDG